jgi:hypothetical protein
VIELLLLPLTGAVVLLLVSAIAAPLESLGWYAGWSGEGDAYRDPPDPKQALLPDVEVDKHDHYLVYLSGIGAISGDSVPDEEYPFIEALNTRLGNTLVINDVFPYAVTNNGLTGQRQLTAFWKWLEARRLKNANDIGALLVNLRNAMQLFVSADRRYGPVYNLGVAQEIRDSLVRHGYRIGSGKPVTLLGWSGGGQISIGAAYYLRRFIQAPLHVVSVGGMLSDDLGIDQLDHLWHLYGEKDQLQALGKYMYRGRWRWFPDSPWNRALREGRIELISLGDFNHNGKGNYFDHTSMLPSGESYMDKTVATMRRCLLEAGIIKAA